MKIQSAAEDYLEAILVLQNKNEQVRSIDIAKHMHYSKPTISVIMKQFRENGYIEMNEEKTITLTEKGMEIAKRTYERHMLIAKMLMELGVDEETAYIDSCKIEHNISDTSFKCIKKKYGR